MLEEIISLKAVRSLLNLVAIHIRAEREEIVSFELKSLLLQKYNLLACTGERKGERNREREEVYERDRGWEREREGEWDRVRAEENEIVEKQQNMKIF